MIIYTAIATFVGYTLYKERQALGCPTIPNGTDCDNANGKAVKGTCPSSKDSNEEICHKIKKASDFADRWVTWRIAILASLPCCALTSLIINKRFPTEHELLVNMIVISSIIYFIFNFYKFHLIDHARNNIIDGIEILKSRVHI